MSRPIHQRLKPIIVGLINGFEAEQAADMILRMVLDPKVTGTSPSPDEPAPAPASKRKPGPRPGSMRAPPVLTEPIDPEKEYTIPAAAECIGVLEGTLRSILADQPDYMEQKRGHRDDGRPSVRIMGAEIIRVREERIARINKKG